MLPEDGSTEAFPARFHRYFQLELTALLEQITSLPNTPTLNGERNDAVDHTLAGIARLNQEVAEASSHLPTYDQRIYGEGVKALGDKLTKVRSEFAPRPKFTFKQALKARQRPVAPSTTDKQNLTGGDQRNGTVTAAVAKNGDREEEIDNAAEVANTLVRDAHEKSRFIHRPEFESARSYSILRQKDVYIAVSPAIRGRDGRAARVLDVQRSIVDLRGASSRAGDNDDEVSHPLATLMVKNVKSSLLVCGRVSGAIHVTGLKDSVLVASCRQLRMHECVNVRVYLHCASRPIIEASKDVGFAPLPDALITADIQSVENQWAQVDDFDWLKAEASPNWHVIKADDRTDDKAWATLASPEEGDALVTGTLEAFRIPLKQDL